MATYEGNTAYNANAAAGNYQVKRIYWGAVLAGALIMLVVLMLLNLLGLGIGFASVNPGQEQNPFAGLGTGALIWWVVSNLLAIFLGGFIAGRLAGIPRGFNSVMHGLLSWCLFAVISAWLLTTSVGSFISGVGSVVTRTVSAAGSAVDVNVPSGQQDQGTQTGAFNIGSLPDDVDASFTLSEQSGEKDLSVGELESIVSNVFMENGNLVQDVSREEVATEVSRQTELSGVEAQQVGDYLYNRYEQVSTNVQNVQQSGGNVADSVASAAIWGFIALVIGAVVAAFAGLAGKPKGVLQPVNESGRQ